MDNYFEREFPEVPAFLTSRPYYIAGNGGSYDLVAGREFYIDRSINQTRVLPSSTPFAVSMYHYNNNSGEWRLSGCGLGTDLNETELIYSNYDILSYADSSLSGSSYIGFYSTSCNETVLGTISSGTVANGILSQFTNLLPIVAFVLVGYIGFLKALKFLHDLIRGA